MNNNVKSATTAGLLGIFLGGVGAHDWYLGDKKKGIIHASLAAGALVLLIAAAVMATSFWMLLRMGWLITLLSIVGWLVALGNSIWGLVEGILILTKGDAGLAQKGYQIATPGMAPVAQNPAVAPATTTTPNPAAAPSVSTSISGSSTKPGGADSATVKETEGGATNTTPTVDSAATDKSAESTDATKTTTVAETTANSSVAATTNNAAPVQQVAVAPKQPMDPAKKKKIIMIASIAGGGVVAVIVLIVVLMIVLHVDYGESYRLAKQARVTVQEVRNNRDCEYVLDYASSTYTKDQDYAKYVEGCKVMANGLDELVDKLGKTAGVSRNKDIKARFDTFKATMDAALPNKEDLEQKLTLYQAWHKFVYAADDLTADSADSEFRSAANALINSGNKTLKEYGEGWLEKTLAYAHAYQNYWAASYSDPDKNSLRTEMEKTRIERTNWISSNRPDITEVAPLDFDNITKMYNDFQNLYSLIAKTYEENYNKGSGDCTEFLSEVSCS